MVEGSVGRVRVGMKLVMVESTAEHSTVGKYTEVEK